MMRVNAMVRAGASQPMKIIALSGDVAECVLIDGRGALRRRFVEIDRLTPMWLSLQPRSLWPEMTHLDLLAIDHEERQAAAAKKAQRRAAKKSKRSNKIKRRAA